MNNFNLMLSVALFLTGCASAPSVMTIHQMYVSGDKPSTEKADGIKRKLTLGENQLSAGYSTEATLITDPLIIAEQTEKGKMNMEDSVKIEKEIEIQKSAFTANKTCFLFSLHTYNIDRAEFKHWVSKVKDASAKISEIKFTSISGIESVPHAYRDANGRTFHNSSVGCTTVKIDTSRPFTLYIIPQLKNNTDQDETTTLIWNIQARAGN